MEPASESFCEVCGDTGGATRLVLCENIDAGCLGGVHLYCCVPLRSEPPSDAWYCSECQAAKKTAAAARQWARQEREMARQQRRAERRQEKEQRKRKRQVERNEARRQRQRQEDEQRRAAAAAQAPQARPKGLPNGGAGLAGVPRQSSGVAAVIAAASGRTAPPAAGRAPTAGAPAAAARAPAGPGGALASKDTLSFLFSSLSKEDARQKEQEEKERQRMERMESMLQGDARRMQGSQAEHAKLWHELAARYNLPACQAAGLCWSGALPLPIPVQDGGSFVAGVACFGLPGNPQSQEAADQSLRPLAAAAAAAQSLPWHFKSCKDDLGLLRPGDAWEQASMLLQVQPDAAPQVAQQWSVLWDRLRDFRQALAIPLPAPAPASGATGSSSGDEGGVDRPFLYLVPNEYEQGHKTLFGLLGLPLPEPEHPRPCSTRQAPGSILRGRRPQEAGAAEHAAAEGPEDAGAAAGAAAAAAAGGSAATQPSTARAVAAAAGVAAEQPEAAEAGASLEEEAAAAGAAAAAGPAGQAAEEESEEEGELTPRAAAAAAGAPALVPAAAAAAAAPRPVLTWADIRGDRSAFDRIDRAALELGKGSHYTTPTRQEAGAVRPARTPVFRSFERQAAEAEARARPLAALHIALWGFSKFDTAMDVLRQLRALGASTYISVQLVNLLVVHPSLVKNNSLEVPSVARDVPLGLAHLLATTDVKAYLDGSVAILNWLARRQRLLRGGQWYAPEFSPIFPGGITAVLDYPMLASMPPDQLGQVLGALESLAAGSPDPTWVWHVAAPPADLAALQAAADKGQAPAADNWGRWQASSAARALSASETQLPQGGPSTSPVVQYAANVARQHMYDCRVVFLCTNDPDTQSQAEERHTILCGGVPELLHLLHQHLQRQPQQKQEWEEQHQQQRLRQQQQQQGQQQGQAHAVMLRPPEQPPPLLRKELRRPPSDFVPQP